MTHVRMRAFVPRPDIRKRRADRQPVSQAEFAFHHDRVPLRGVVAAVALHSFAIQVPMPAREQVLVRDGEAPFAGRGNKGLRRCRSEQRCDEAGGSRDRGGRGE